MVTTLLLLVDFGPMASSLVVVVSVSQRDAHIPWDQLAAGKAVPERTMSSSLSILGPWQFEITWSSRCEGHRTPSHDQRQKRDVPDQQKQTPKEAN